MNAFVSNQASELGSRMSSMESASKNASDMLKRLTLKYNRGRQANITTELTEVRWLLLLLSLSLSPARFLTAFVAFVTCSFFFLFVC